MKRALVDLHNSEFDCQSSLNNMIPRRFSGFSNTNKRATWPYERLNHVKKASIADPQGCGDIGE